MRSDLVGLVDLAPGGLDTLSAVLRRWQHVGRTQRADTAGRSRLSGGVSIVFGVSAGGTGPVPEAFESRAAVWFAAPARWAVVGDDAVGQLDISDGDRRWQGSHGAVVDQGPSPALVEAGQLGWMLAPGFLLGLHRFVDVVEEVRSGRRCWQATAVPRASGAYGRMRAFFSLANVGDGSLGNTAMVHRFWFDAEHGFVVRHEATFEGEPAAVHELGDVVAGAPVPPGRFAVPAGIERRSAWDARMEMLEKAGIDTSTIAEGDEDAAEAASTALRPGPSLADRVAAHVPTGPPPRDPGAAEAAITAAFVGIGEAGPPGDGDDLVNVQAGRGLAPLLADAGRRLPGATPENTRWAVDAIRFLSPDQAAVWFSIDVAGRPSMVRQRCGRAVLDGDRWLVEHATVADLLAMANITTPAPDTR